MNEEMKNQLEILERECEKKHEETLIAYQSLIRKQNGIIEEMSTVIDEKFKSADEILNERREMQKTLQKQI